VKLNILYHHRTQGRGAEGVHISSIVHALRAMGHDVTVISPPGIDPLDPAQSAPVDKARVRTEGLQTLWKVISKFLPNFLFELAEILYNVPAYRRLNAVLAERRFDLIYERYAFFLIAGAMVASRHGIPYVCEANEVSGIADRARRQFFPRLCSRFERFIFARCTGILTVSSHLRDRILKQGVKPARVRVVPNAFDVGKVSGVVKSDALADQLGIGSRLTIGFAGWFDRWDRLDFLIEAFRRLRTKHDGIVLLLIGDGPVLTEIRKLVHEYGLGKDVIFTGAVPRLQVYRYIQLIDIAVLPHSNDFGSPVVMFEFMGLRKPVVAPRLGPIEDVHRHEETALLFQPLDVCEFQNAMERLVLSPDFRRQLAERGHDKLTQQYTWRRNAELILEVAGIARNGSNQNGCINIAPSGH
jgi:glycosyltransferase involved in cell wall biosynthesis